VPAAMRLWLQQHRLHKYEQTSYPYYRIIPVNLKGSARTNFPSAIAFMAGLVLAATYEEIARRPGTVRSAMLPRSH
jgi:hypothetical protein